MKTLRVGDVMTRKVVALDLEHSIHLASSLMRLNHIRHLPVIDNFSLIGVVSIRDISSAFDEEATPFKLAMPA